MMVLSFPRSRDRGFVRRAAARMADYRPAAAQNYLRYQIGKQRETMERRGIDPITIDEQLRALEVAIRCEVGRFIVTSDGAA